MSGDESVVAAVVRDALESFQNRNGPSGPTGAVSSGSLCKADLGRRIGEAGTPLSAARMGVIETGLFNADYKAACRVFHNTTQSLSSGVPYSARFQLGALRHRG